MCCPLIIIGAIAIQSNKRILLQIATVSIDKEDILNIWVAIYKCVSTASSFDLGNHSEEKSLFNALS